MNHTGLSLLLTDYVSVAQSLVINRNSVTGIQNSVEGIQAGMPVKKKKIIIYHLRNRLYFVTCFIEKIMRGHHPTDFCVLTTFDHFSILFSYAGLRSFTYPFPL
jgi:hypothetical protein